ncbi:tetratricopeptide repeat protein [Allokutzneria oryzae]|uniref:tetratricopeptide repeat protein n=1 Tax=Allokutzneria oryzae TaxID=1378989 RepID=UPI0036729BA1
MVADPKIALLPLRDLLWENFERLLLDFAQAEDDVAEARRYGVAGQAQAGIDVAGRSSNGRWYAYQAKKVDRLTESDVRAALDAFVEGRRPFGASRLVIATTSEGTRTQASDLIHSYRSAHPSLSFELVWDAQYISNRLRRLPRIVGRYFGDHVAWRFCDADVLAGYMAPQRQTALLGTELAGADPFALGVHEAIEAYGAAGALPAYVRRPFDAELAEVVRRACAGKSAVAVLVGDSSTGKTRACWEAVCALPVGWRVWQPARGAEILNAPGRIGPRTVLWLDEIKRLLLSGDHAADERVAVALGGLIGDRIAGPVLVLGTAWHEDWIEMTRPPGREDEYKQRRMLLVGRRIVVPEIFEEKEIGPLRTSNDARLAEAGEHAEGGHVTQYLAGGPAQLERYENAPPLARAVLDAAADARRLAPGIRLTEQFLAAAGDASLTSLQRDLLPDDWFAAVIAYTGAPCRGARGALGRVRPSLLTDVEHEPELRLADYLEQKLSRERATLCPADWFWTVAERFAATAGDRVAFVSAALTRGRLAAAERLADRAAALGDPRGLERLGAHAEEQGLDALPYFERAARAGSELAMVKLGFRYEDRGRLDEAEQMFRAALSSSEKYDAKVGLGSVLWARGEHEAAIDLYEEALSDDGGPRAVEYQARELASRGDHELALELTCRSFAAGNSEAFTGLAWCYVGSDHERAVQVLRQALLAGDRNALRELAIVHEHSGDLRLAEKFGELAARYGDISGLCLLSRIRGRRGDLASARGALWQAYNTGQEWVLLEIGELHERMGDLKRAERFYRRRLRQTNSSASGHSLADGLVRGLIRVLARTGRFAEAEQLAVRSGSCATELLASLCTESGNYADASRLLDDLVGRGYSRALLQLARVQQSAGDLSGAEQSLRRACDAGVSGALRQREKFREEVAGGC